MEQNDKVNMEEIEKVIFHLLNNEGVFYASLLTQMRRTANSNFPFAAGVTIKGGYIEMYWNPEKFKEMKDIGQKAAVLEHECQHLVKNHLTRLQNKDAKMWNIAADLAINQVIKHLPDWVCTIDKYPPEFKMLPDKPAEYYYNQLKKNQQYVEFKQGADGKTKVEIKDKDGKTQMEFDLDSPGNHEKWDEKDGKSDSPEVKEEVVRQTVKKALEQTERFAGKVPSELQDDVDALLKPPVIPWQRVLRQWIGMRVKAGFKYSWKRPNKRYGMTQKGKIPTRKLVIAVAIDTSGSISDADLQAFMVEIQGIMSSYKSKILMIECDAEIQKVYKLTPFAKVDPKFKGRGGTSFVPVFEYITEKHEDIDLLIYFTDLCGSFPDKAPQYPVLWVTVDSHFTAPWGDTMELDTKTQQRD